MIEPANCSETDILCIFIVFFCNAFTFVENYFSSLIVFENLATLENVICDYIYFTTTFWTNY